MYDYCLTSQLAQEIVDRTMNIIDCNINVMDENGCIIGSGDSNRLGEFHEGALLAIKQKRTVVIDEAMANHLHGVRPGVNLPLYLNSKIVGVIGLTGEPTQIKQFGELVSMTAVMMLEQAEIYNHLNLNDRFKEEIILAYIDNGTIPDNITEWSKKLNINFSIPRVAFIIEVDSGQLGVNSAFSELQEIKKLIEYNNSDNLVAIQSLTEIICLSPALNKFNRWDIEEKKKKIFSLESDIQRLFKLQVKIALGNFFFESPEEAIKKSYETAKITLQVGKAKKPKLRVYCYQDIMLPVLLYGLNFKWSSEELLKPLNILLHEDANGILIKTLTIWFKNNLIMSETAKELFIHRNTLDYRLKRISDITKLDLLTIESKVLLYVALQLKN
ncbi:sugar diacid recognition domain-containing protein [Providencia manganoxydans]|uniref:sugar diacid recognition domain-containing protein n=1 Tax=Providencia manganoxydans TaxID=2923283 RepID=UPI00281001C3|nr:helix-turn-helix domain-containing protein [Providencia stuartii]ELR5083561.1 helix-turn-helix domain-containing protein [Providencia stuartii]